jgi:hypothetical protein
MKNPKLRAKTPPEMVETIVHDSLVTAMMKMMRQSSALTTLPFHISGCNSEASDQVNRVKTPALQREKEAAKPVAEPIPSVRVPAINLSMNTEPLNWKTTTEMMMIPPVMSTFPATSRRFNMSVVLEGAILDMLASLDNNSRMKTYSQMEHVADT